MRIIYLHQYFVTPDQPYGTRSYEFGKRLVSNGHDVTMISTDFLGIYPDATGWIEASVDGMRVFRYPYRYSNEMGLFSRLSAFLKFARQAGKKAAQIGGDVVFASSTPLTIAIPGVRAAKKGRIPLVFEVRDLWPRLPIALGVLRNPLLKFLARRLEKYAYKNSERIVALCPGMKRGIVSTGYPEERVRVIPNCCDFDLFDAPPDRADALRREFSWLGSRPLVTYTGTVGLANDVQYLVKLAAAVLPIDPEIRFLVVGDGREKEAVRRLAAECGVLDRNFFLLPSMPKMEIVSVFAASTLPTVTLANFKELEDNSSNKFFDGLAAGKPVAINYGGWEADLLRKHDCGIVLDPDRIPEAALLLTRRLGDPDWLRSAGRRARELGRRSFDRDTLAGQLESVLREAVAEERGERV